MCNLVEQVSLWLNLSDCFFKKNMIYKCQIDNIFFFIYFRFCTFANHYFNL